MMVVSVTAFIRSAVEISSNIINSMFCFASHCLIGKTLKLL